MGFQIVPVFEVAQFKVFRSLGHQLIENLIGYTYALSDLALGTSTFREPFNFIYRRGSVLSRQQTWPDQDNTCQK